MEKIIFIALLAMLSCTTSKLNKLILNNPENLEKLNTPFVSLNSTGCTLNIQQSSFLPIDSVICERDSILFFSCSSITDYNTIVNLLPILKEKGYSSIGFLAENFSDVEVMYEELSVSDFAKYYFSVPNFIMLSRCEAMGFKLFNVSAANNGPNIKISDTMAGNRREIKYVSKDENYFANYIVENGNTTIETNWDKELKLAEKIDKAITKYGGKWVVVFGEQHLYKDRSFSAASYLENNYNRPVVSIHNSDYSIEGRKTCIVKDDKKVCSSFSERFDYILMHRKGEDYARFLDLNCADCALKKIKNTGKASQFFLFYEKKRFKKNKMCLPSSGVYLKPQESIELCLPNKKYKIKKIKVINGK